MHGLIFVTWENYLGERFGPEALYHYREKVRALGADAPLVSKMYDDATLLAGVGAASALTRTPADTLLHEYGSYFIQNGLTSRLCSYLLVPARAGDERARPVAGNEPCARTTEHHRRRHGAAAFRISLGVQ